MKKIMTNIRKFAALWNEVLRESQPYMQHTYCMGSMYCF